MQKGKKTEAIRKIDISGGRALAWVNNSPVHSTKSTRLKCPNPCFVNRKPSKQAKWKCSLAPVWLRPDSKSRGWIRKRRPQSASAPDTTGQADEFRTESGAPGKPCSLEHGTRANIRLHFARILRRVQKTHTSTGKVSDCVFPGTALTPITSDWSAGLLYRTPTMDRHYQQQKQQ